MFRFLFIFLSFLSILVSVQSFALPADTSRVRDSTSQLYDTSLSNQNSPSDKHKITDSALAVMRAKHFFYENRSLQPSAAKLQPYRTYRNNAPFFYLSLVLLLILGLLRVRSPRYFNSVFANFMNTGTVGRQLKQQVANNNLLNFFMNTFYCLVAGVYVFFLIKTLSNNMRLEAFPQAIGIMICIGFFVAVYLVRYCALLAAGRLFDLKEAAKAYIYNIFLVNKVTAILLLPFVAVMSLGNPLWAKVAAVASIIVFFLTLLNRYARSQGVISKLIRVNKFHFFLYLCASEILPLAVLVKLVVQYI